MKRFALALSLMVVGSVNAQDVNRHRVYSPYYNGWGQQPGLSVYNNGTYSVDYFGGSRSYDYGYVPAARANRGRRYNAGNGLMNNPSIFYYEGMHLSPYNVNSPIWGW